MPNWCFNTAEVTHKNPAMLKMFSDSFDNSTLFSNFFPLPEGRDDWYEWAIEEWGTKWDARKSDSQFVEETSTLHIDFETAWSPPIAAYKKFTDLGFNINSTFHESGMCFIGTWKSDDGEEYYEYDFSDENWRDDLPPDLISMLESDYAFYLECHEEPEDEP